MPKVYTNTNKTTVQKLVQEKRRGDCGQTIPPFTADENSFSVTSRWNFDYLAQGFIIPLSIDKGDN